MEDRMQCCGQERHVQGLLIILIYQPRVTNVTVKTCLYSHSVAIIHINQRDGIMERVLVYGSNEESFYYELLITLYFNSTIFLDISGKFSFH